MKHDPVLLKEVLTFLAVRMEGRYLDCTFGGGGHSEAMVRSASTSLVDAIDRDPAAEVRAKGLREAYGERFRFFHFNFDQIEELPNIQYDGILFDLGLSSFQLDEDQRGFSFRREAPLDMRMNPNEGLSAAQWLQQASESELVEAVRNFGEEKEWRRVVRALLEARERGGLSHTKALAELVEGAKSPRARRLSSIHPATLTFQGIRIAVNDELGAIQRALPQAFERLASGGCLVVISFHSLEDRIVKQFFRRMCGQPEHSRDSLPQQMRTCLATPLTRRPVMPSEEERERNPRSRSAKLRALKKR